MYINTKFSSVNYPLRTCKIEYIILHYTEIPLEDALAKLTDPESEVSAHYLIKEDGEVLQLVDDYKIAWHAGKSSWKNFTHLNSYSLGIEIDNPGTSEFSAIQMQSCIELCSYLVNKHNINSSNVIGHSDVAPDRKSTLVYFLIGTDASKTWAWLLARSRIPPGFGKYAFNASLG